MYERSVTNFEKLQNYNSYNIFHNSPMSHEKKTKNSRNYSQKCRISVVSFHCWHLLSRPREKKEETFRKTITWGKWSGYKAGIYFLATALISTSEEPLSSALHWQKFRPRYLRSRFRPRDHVRIKRGSFFPIISGTKCASRIFLLLFSFSSGSFRFSEIVGKAPAAHVSRYT